MTSPPKGCWRLSIERTASGWPDSRSSSVATTVVVPRSNAIAWRVPVVSPGSTSISSSSTMTAVTLKRARAQHAAELAHDRQRNVRLEVVDGVEQALDVGALVLQRRLVELDVALLHRRAQDHVAPDADQRRLGARLQRRHADHEVLARGRAAGQPPAVAQLVRAERARVDRADRRLPAQHLHLALAARAVAAARRVDRDPVPARGVEDRRPARHAHLGAVGQEAQQDALGAVGGALLVHRLLLARELRARAHDAAAAWPPRARGARRSSARPTRRGRAAGRPRARSARPPRRSS